MSGERALRQLQKAKEKLRRGGGGGGAEEAALCNQLGELLASHGRYGEALEEHRHELRLLEAAGDGLGCAVAHRKIGERLAELGRYGEALEHQRRHLELARALGDAAEQQRAWATIGRTHMFVADSLGGGPEKREGEEEEEEEVKEEVKAALREAEGAFRTSLAIVEEKLEGSVPRRELSAMRCRLYLNLGLVYDSLGDAGRRGRYLQRSVFLAERARLDEDLQRAYFNLGAIHLRHGRHPRALRCLQRARDCARRLQDKALESECCSSTGQVLLSLGDFAAAKRALRAAHTLGSRQRQQRRLVRSNLRYATEVTRLQEALEEAAGEPAAALGLCERLGDVFSRHGDFGRALEHYQRQLSYAEALCRPAPELAAIHVSLATTYGDLRQPARAEHHYRQELALHRGDPLEEGRTWLSIAMAKEEAGEPRAELEACLGTALERAEAAGELRLQRQVLRHLHALQQRAGSAEAAATMARLRGLPGGEEEEEEEEEEQENGEGREEEEGESSELELSESEGEDEQLDGYTKSVPGRRRICKWTRRNERGETPLHRACIEGDLRRVQLYLQQGHPLNPRDYCGWTPLHEACNHGHLEVVRLLLERGAAVNDAGGPGCEGVTPLHDALGCGHFEVAELLLRSGAARGARNAKGLTPLGTLEEWVGLYGPELDEETWQRCRRAERALREGGAPASPPASQLFDAELPEPPVGGSGDTAGPPAAPLAPPAPSQSPPRSPSPSQSPPRSPSPLRPARKRPRGAGAASPSPPQTIQAQYEAAIRGLGSSRSLPVPPSPPQSGGGPPGAPPALIPAEEYVEDWLEDDLGAKTGRKRGRREPRGGVGVPRGGVGVSRGGLGPPGAARRRRHRPPPAPQGSPEAPGEEEQPPPGPAPLPPIRVRVRVQGDVFLIPVPQGSSPSVSWLGAQAAERYRQARGARPQLTLSKEGALLAPRDRLRDLLHCNEEVLGEVQSWELPPLAERYRTACHSLGLAPQPLLLRAAERQALGPGFNAGGLAPRPPQLPPLLRALRLQPPLRQLRLGGCGVADGHGPELGAALSALPALLLLDLSDNRLGPGGLHHLAQPGCAPQGLEELDLSLNPLGDAGCRPLALLLRSCPALATLRLRACGFSPRCHLELSHGLAGASRLRALALGRNALGAAGLEPLLRALPAATLGHLDLGSVRGEDPLPLATALGGFLERGGRALARLELPGNGLDDAAVAELARRLPSCPSLCSLDLSANPSITSAGLRALLVALGERGQRLQYLSLAGCSVEGPLDAATWARAAAGVRDLRLCGRGVQRGGPPGTDPPGTATLRRHHKLFCTGL